MNIRIDVLNAALDAQFNAVGLAYEIVLLLDVAGTSTPEVVDFTVASSGSVQLASSVFFAIDAGETVTGLQVRNEFAVVLIEETVPNEVFATAGTFTVNNITVTLTA